MYSCEEQVKAFVGGAKVEANSLLAQMFRLKPGTDKTLLQVHHSS